jgi:TonB-dependent receptor
MKKIVLFLIAAMFSNLIFAQDGFLKGTILDKSTNEALIGANIIVSNLSGVGAVTDLDGNYTIKLAAGSYTIKYSFISYETITKENVVIKAGETTAINETLGESSVEVGEVVVAAAVSRKSESAILTMQKKSVGVMDGISMEQISKLGDGNAASALKRVTGISVEGGKYVFVRGLGERYTKTTLNSAEIPGLDPEKNSVQLDIFPSNIIQNITVKKTFTPDMSGEATGGQVNILTRDFPDQLSFQWSSSFTYNTQSSFNKNFISYNTPATDWLGFDNGSRAIPSYIQNLQADMAKNNIEQISIVYYNPDKLNEIYNAFNKNVYPIVKPSFMDQSHKISLGNQVKFLNHNLGFNFSLSYSNSYDYYDNGVAAVYTDIVPSTEKLLNVRKGTQDTKIAGLLNLSYKLSDNNNIGLRLMKTQSGENITSYGSGHFFYEGPDVFIQERNESYLQRGLTSVQLNGKHYLNEDLKIEWLSSLINMTQSEPDARFFTNFFQQQNGDTVYKILTNTLPSRIWRNFSELDFDNKIDIEMPAKFINSESKIKIGGSCTYKNRQAKQNKFELRADNVAYKGNQSLDGNYQDLLSQPISSSNPTGIFYTGDVNNDLIGSYFASQNIYAAYAMADMPLGNNWRIVTGLRMESLLMQTENLISASDAKHAKGSLPATDLLPSLNITYKISDEANFRMAYSQTIARPQFKEFAPQSFYDYKISMRVNGNPDLKESHIQNLDLRYEYFFDRGQLLALSAFYKKFTNPIEAQLNPAAGNAEIMYVNGDVANLYGFEAEVRKSLDFIGVQGFSVGANFTYVKSIVDIQADLQALRNEKTRTMVGQAPYVVNTFLNYKNEERRFDFNIGFNVSGKKLALVTGGTTPYIYELPQPNLNLNLGKELGKNWGIELSADNLMNVEYRSVYNYADGYLDNLRYSTGRSFSFTVKYKL